MDAINKIIYVYAMVEIDEHVMILEIVLLIYGIISCNETSSVGFVIAMESMKGQGGIQMLLTAEQEAQQIVSAAKNCNSTILMCCTLVILFIDFAIYLEQDYNPILYLILVHKDHFKDLIFGINSEGL